MSGYSAAPSVVQGALSRPALFLVAPGVRPSEPLAEAESRLNRPTSSSASRRWSNHDKR